MIFDPTSSDLHLIWRTFIDFERFIREPDKDINYFIEEWKERMFKVHSAGCQYSDLLLGLKLIEKVNLSQDSVVSVISNLSSSSCISESFLTQVVKNIKKQSNINKSTTNQSEKLFNVTKANEDDQDISEKIESKGNQISCCKCPLKFYDFASLLKHSLKFHPDMTNAKILGQKMGTRSDSGFLKCPICDKNFMIMETLKKHIGNHDSKMFESGLNSFVDSSEAEKVNEMDATTITSNIKKEIKAETCTKQGKKRVSKKIPGKTFSCKICSKEYPKLWKVNKHMRVHRTTKNYKCAYCDNAYKWDNSLRLHLLSNHLKEQAEQKHHKTPVALVDIDISERGTNSSVNQDWTVGSEVDTETKNDNVLLNVRVKTEIKSEICKESSIINGPGKSYKCSFCTKEWERPWMLMRHMEVHKVTRDYKCSQCGKSFKGKEGLKKHLVKMHSDGNLTSKEQELVFSMSSHKEEKIGLNFNPGDKKPIKNFPCEICGKAFTEYNLKRHIERTHSVKLFKCINCPKEFAKLSVLERHMEIHNRTFECTICHKTWKNSSLLKFHMETHKTTRDYVCTYCGKKYKTLNVFKEHLNLHTKSRPMPCKFCGKVFFQYSSWKFHTRRYHTGEKPYKCDFCDKRFYLSTKKANHMRTHTGEKPFPCHVCGRYFRETNSLKRHIRNVHKVVNPNTMSN